MQDNENPHDLLYDAIQFNRIQCSFSILMYAFIPIWDPRHSSLLISHFGFLNLTKSRWLYCASFFLEGNLWWVELFGKIFWRVWMCSNLKRDFRVVIMKGFVFWVLFFVFGTAMVLLSFSTEASTSAVPGEFLFLSFICVFLCWIIY